MHGKFGAQCLQNNRYLINGNIITIAPNKNNNKQCLRTGFYVGHRAENFVCVNCVKARNLPPFHAGMLTPPHWEASLVSFMLRPTLRSQL